MMKKLLLFLAIIVSSLHFVSAQTISLRGDTGNKKVVIGLPPHWRVEYIAKEKTTEPNPTYYVVIWPDEGTYNDFTLYVGHIGKIFSNKKVTSGMRYKDGGTTIIETEIGTLLFPTSINPYAKPPTLTLDDKVTELVKLDH